MSRRLVSKTHMPQRAQRSQSQKSNQLFLSLCPLCPLCSLCSLCSLWLFLSELNAAPLPGFEPSPHFQEQMRELRIDDCRILINVAGSFDANKTTRLILYTLPNGNSIEWTIGCRWDKS